MKKWGRNVVVGSIVSCLFVLTACGSSGNSGANGSSTPASSQTAGTKNIQSRVMKAGIVSPKGHPQALGLDKFAEIVEKNSGGKMKIQKFNDGTLGDDKKMMEALQGGLQEIAVITTPPVFGTIKEFGIFDFPLVFKNEKEADAIMDGPIGKKLLDKLPAHNLVGLAYWENGFRSITNSKHPIQKADDLKGLKIRTLPNQIHLEAFKTWGSNPTPMVFAEVFAALESKAIDGQENSLAVIESHKLYEVQKYLSITNHLYAPFVFLVSKKYWDQLSDEEKKIIQDAVAESTKFQRETNRSMAKKTLENLKSKGMQVNEMPAEEVAKMQEVTKPLIDKFSKDVGEDLVKELFSELEKLRK